MSSEVALWILLIAHFIITVLFAREVLSIRRKIQDSPALHFVESQDPAPKPPLESTTKVLHEKGGDHPVIRRTQFRGRRRR